MSGDYDSIAPNYDPMDKSWINNPEGVYSDGDELNSKTDFFRDLGKYIVERHSNDKDTLEKYVQGLESAHKRHIQLNNDSHQSDLATLFADAGIGNLTGEISTFQGKWNNEIKKKIGDRAKYSIQFHTPEGAESIQFILRGVEAAMHK